MTQSTENEDYIIVDGHHRFIAARREGIKIPGVVIDKAGQCRKAMIHPDGTVEIVNDQDDRR